jgi:hypothetical protein
LHCGKLGIIALGPRPAFTALFSLRYGSRPLPEWSLVLGLQLQEISIMLTHDQSDIARQRQTVPAAPTVPPTQVNQFPGPSRHIQSERPETPEVTPQSSDTQNESEVTRMTPGKAQESGRSSFGLEQIRTISFRCGRCRTVVRFPRIRWTSFPECCPNCRTQWMTQPTSQGSWQEDTSTYLFRVVLAFREALQALAGMERTAVFTLALETSEYPNDGHAAPTPNGRNGRSRAW